MQNSVNLAAGATKPQVLPRPVGLSRSFHSDLQNPSSFPSNIGRFWTLGCPHVGIAEFLRHLQYMPTTLTRGPFSGRLRELGKLLEDFIPQPVKNPTSRIRDKLNTSTLGLTVGHHALSNDF